MNELSALRAFKAKLADFTVLPVIPRGTVPTPAPIGGYVEFRGFGFGEQSRIATGLEGGPVAFELHVFGAKLQGDGPALAAAAALAVLFRDISLPFPAGSGDSGALWFERHGTVDLGVDPRGYYQLVKTLIFTNRTDFSPEAPAVAGIALNSSKIAQTAHGLTIGTWVSLDGGSDLFTAAQAFNGNPPALGVVSRVDDPDHFWLTTQGDVLIAAHGLAVGPIYLSRSVPGSATSTAPASGILQQLGTVYNADHIIVGQPLVQMR